MAADDLSRRARLARVCYYEVSARRHDGFARPSPCRDAGEEGVQEVMARPGDDGFALRGRISLCTDEAHFIADVAVFYTLPGSAAPHEDVVRAFAERSGPEVLAPYLWEAIREGARRIGVDQPVLGITPP